jgi:hypothetical protein
VISPEETLALFTAYHGALLARKVPVGAAVMQYVTDEFNRHRGLCGEPELERGTIYRRCEWPPSPRG